MQYSNIPFWINRECVHSIRVILDEQLAEKWRYFLYMGADWPQVCTEHWTCKLHLHQSTSTLHCTVIFLSLSLSGFLDSCSDIQNWKSCMLVAGPVQDPDERYRIPSSRHCDDDYRGEKKLFSFSTRCSGTATNWNLSVMNFLLKGRKSRNIYSATFKQLSQKEISHTNDFGSIWNRNIQKMIRCQMNWFHYSSSIPLNCHNALLCFRCN